MTARVIVQLLLLPLVVLAVPLMFGLAWVQEAISDLAPGTAPPPHESSP
jgi:hypothetical protein